MQISKLRFFISLVVDQKEKKGENRGIRPLPNLETKFVAANSLIGLEKPAQLPMGYNLIEPMQDELQAVRHRHFEAKSRREKIKCQKEDKAIRKKIADKLKSLGFGNKDADKIAQFDIYDQNIFANWFESEWMFGNDVANGFDVVIGNPPYITYKGKEVVDITDAEVKQLISLYPNSAEYKVNSYALFTERGVNLLKKNGTLAYIIPSTILQNKYLKKIRKYLITKFHISQIVSFANKVFEAVTDSIILKVNNNHSGELKTIAIRKNDLDFSNLDDLKTYNPEKWNDEANDFVINLKTNESEDEIISKIENSSTFLDSFLEANIGIKRADAPIIDRPESGYKKFLVGRNINKFILEFPNSYILFDQSLFHTGIDENIFREKEKVLVRKTGNKLIAVWDNEKYYTDQSIYNLYPKRGKSVNLKVVTALLNSPMLEYYFNKKMITNPDVFPYIKGIHLKKLPIKFPKNQSEEKQFETLVEKIVEGKKEDKNTSKWEQQLNALVYKLYGLTPEEIAIVEGKG